MRWLISLLRLTRRQWRALTVVAVLSSCSTASSLVEPWLYRAVIDDVAGVFASPGPLTFADRAIEDVVASLHQMPASVRRLFSAPLQRFEGPAGTRRHLPPRLPQEAIATVLVAAALLLVTRLVSEACRVRGDNLAASISSEIESGLILRTFEHVTRLPLRAFVSRPSAAIARQVDQTDQVSPLFIAASKEIWPELFSLIAMIAGTSRRTSRHASRALSLSGHRSGAPMGERIVEGLWGVRYQVTDVPRAIEFYTKVLGFTLDFQNLPAFGQVSLDNLKLILSGPGASGSRPMPDGRTQEGGGWNRVVLQVRGLPDRIEALRARGVRFRNEMEVGPGGKQIQIEDPDGNPVELFEPAARR